MQYSVVIPVYNSVQTLNELVQRLHAVFESLALEYEIIFVEDCSPNPDTWKTVASLAKRNPRVTAIQLSRNFGQQSATLCGMAESQGEFVITMDDDLQHNPEDIPKLIELNSHDIVIGQFPDRKHSWFKRTTSALKSHFDTLLIGKPRNIRLSSFRMINRTTVNGMIAVNTPAPFIPALMFHVSKDVAGVPISHSVRNEGTSNYTFFKLLGVFNNLIIGNSSLLLKLIGYIGVIMAIISFCYAGLIALRQLTDPSPIAGWTSVMVTVLFVGGLLLFSIGVIGEYLIRIIAAVESRQSYVIRQKVD